MERPPLTLNVWSGAATVLVVAALVSCISVLSGPYSSGDSKLFYSLGPTLLAGCTLFAALVVMERGLWLLGYASLLAVPFGWLLAIYALWQEATSTSDSSGELWTGLLTLVVALMATTSSLLATTVVAKALAIAAVATALIATILSVEAAWSGDQFWRVGTAITTCWIVAVSLYFLVPIAASASRQRPYWLAGAPVVVLAAVAGIAALVAGEFSPQGYSIAFTLIAAVLTTAALLGGVVVLARGARAVGWITIVTSPLAFGMLVEGIWNDSDDRFRFIATGVVLALALLVAVSARLFAHTRASIALAGAAGVLAAVTTAISVDAIWRDERYFLVAKTTTALWILAIACSLLVPLLERYQAETARTPG
jgi:hypothetical protein